MSKTETILAYLGAAGIILIALAALTLIVKGIIVLFSIGTIAAGALALGLTGFTMFAVAAIALEILEG